MTKTDIFNLLYDSPVEVGHWVGFDKLTDLHNEWLKLFLYGDEDVTLQAHRGSYKTTVLSLFFAIHLLEKPSESVIYFRKTDTDVMEIARQTKKILTSGAFQTMAQIIYGVPLELTKDSATEIDTTLHTGIGGQSQITGIGIQSSITGKHADIIVTDDIVNLRDRVSRADREATKRAYQELQNIKNRGGRIINTGTPWHKDDCFTLMPNLNKFDVYQTGLVSKEEQKKLRASMSPSLYSANYELKHIADSEALFTEPSWLADDEQDAIEGGTAHIDAAYGGSDYTAYTVLKRLDDGRIAAEGHLWQKHVDDCLDSIAAYHEVLKAGSIYCEDNGDKGYLKKELEARGFYARSYHEKLNKFVKISTYLRKNWNNIYWTESTDPAYLAQILDYTEHAEHDDAPDSIASLIRATEQAPTVNTAAYLRGGW